MKRGRLVLAVVALLVAFGAGWWFGSPWWTLYQMKAAAEAGDSGALSAHIDYQAVRASAKAQIGERLDDSRLGTGERLIAGLGANLAVEALVSPAGLRGLFVVAPAARAAYPSPGEMRASDMAMRRDGLDQFRLVRRDGLPGELVFHRSGLGWKLAEIRVPR